jgi:glycosyltransferase involved in cell wall biosynthesis
MTEHPAGAVIIAAYNEETVIARCLTALTPVLEAGSLQVIVACNGCTDRTASIAAAYRGVTVLEIPTASKAAALRAGDAIAVTGPRIYLDADVVMSARTALAVIARLAPGGALAARPPLSFDTAHSGWPVRRWYRVRTRLPSIRAVLWGAGTYALSVAGRGRFGEFPDIVSDDLFIDSLFTATERTIVETDPVVVRAPRTTADLLRILRRTYRTQGDVDLDPGGISTAQRAQLSDLAGLLWRTPLSAVDVAVYAGLIVFARSQVRFARTPAPAWERDVSSREDTIV